MDLQTSLVPLVKVCLSCGKDLPSDAHFNRKRCEVCSAGHERDRARLKAKEWYEANPARALASRKAWREANPHKMGAYYVKWRSNPQNDAKAKEWIATWVKQNRVKMREYQKRWYVENQAALRESVARRAGLYRASDFQFEDWFLILEVFGHRCAYCLRGDVKLTMDHVIPISKGGEHTSDNIIPACTSCNSKKNNRLIFTMLSAA